MDRTIIGIGAHADDVEIHFGGTLLKYMDQGYRIVYVQSTNNMSGGIRRREADGSYKKRAPDDPSTVMKYRKAECDAAAVDYGTTPIHLDHPQRHYDLGPGQRVKVNYGAPLPPGLPLKWPCILTASEDPASVARVADLILEHNPEAIFTHGLAEVNPEHTATALLVIRGYWKAVAAGYQGSLLLDVDRFDDVLGKFNAQWETWVDVSDYIERRMAVLQKHVSQYPPDFEGGVTYWNDILRKRGESCGVKAAEIFNFIQAPSPDADHGPLIQELLRNQAEPGRVWTTRQGCAIHARNT